jgi:hypothetical protein
MSGRRWLECVERELSRGKLPRQEVARLMAELFDHLADVMESRSATGTCPADGTASVVSLNSLTEEDMSMDASVVETLGSPTEIAKTAVREFRRRGSLLSRSRLAAILTFVLLPLPLWLFSWVMASVLFARSLEWIGVVRATATIAGGESWIEIMAANFAIIIAAVAPSAALVALFARLSRRTRRPLLWGLTACALVGLATAFERSSVSFDRPPGQRYCLEFYSHCHSIVQLLQCLIPLLVGALVLRRQAKQAEHTPEV